MGRSHHTIKRFLSNPETQRDVQDEKAILADMYREKARACVAAIDDEKIAKSSALQLATAAGICTDKHLLLTGDAPPIRLEVLLATVDAIRAQRERDDLAVSTRNQEQ
jgi:hypothetical protein